MSETLFVKTIGNSSNHLIILHGIFGMGDNWNSIGKQLSENFTVHLVDVRNHGRSFRSEEMNYPAMANDVVSYLKIKNIEKAAIIGHSMGGKIAMQAVLDYPIFFAKSAIIDIAPKKYPPQHNEVIVALKNLDLYAIKKREDIDSQLKEYLPEINIRQWIMKSIYLDNGSYKLKFNLDTILKNYDLLSNGIVLSKNSSSKIPILFIKGENSNYIELPNDLILIKSMFPNYELIEIKNAGHWTQADNPIDLYQSLFDFFVN